MPGLYLGALVLSIAGVAAIDLRWRLALPRAPWRTLTAVALGTAFFLAWDAAAIALGVFVQGDGPWFTGLQLAPQLPVEEPVFLAFLSYLALVVAGAWRRWRSGAAQKRRDEGDELP